MTTTTAPRLTAKGERTRATIIDAGTAPDMVARFVGLFGPHLDPTVAVRLGSWAATDMVSHVERVLERWQRRLQTMTNQRDRLREREKALNEVVLARWAKRCGDACAATWNDLVGKKYNLTAKAN